MNRTIWIYLRTLSIFVIFPNVLKTAIAEPKHGFDIYTKMCLLLKLQYLCSPLGSYNLGYPFPVIPLPVPGGYLIGAPTPIPPIPAFTFPTVMTLPPNTIRPPVPGGLPQGVPQIPNIGGIPGGAFPQGAAKQKHSKSETKCDFYHGKRYLSVLFQEIIVF